MVAKPEVHRRAVIGNASSFWLHSTREDRFDLTHPQSPHLSAPVSPRLDITTTTTPITVDPSKTALVVIDMQNFFLSESFGRQKGAGHLASGQLKNNAIPACRKAGIQICWVNWGLTDSDIDNMPPAIIRAFGFESVVDEEGSIDATTEQPEDGFKNSLDNANGLEHDVTPPQAPDRILENGKNGRIYKGLGSQCGSILVDGKEIDAGRLLMRDQWNSALHPPLDSIYEEGRKQILKPDVWLHKNRMSGMWGPKTEMEEFLEREGIRTLLFAGVNTDQCVSGTVTDCFSKGYDCVLLSDGCGTTSPGFAQECVEFNAAKNWGFVATCVDLARGVEEMLARGK